MENKCRSCGCSIPVGGGVYIEDDCCHCESCHNSLYTDKAWKLMYDLNSSPDDPGGMFFYTEVQVGEEYELFN